MRPVLIDFLRREAAALGSAAGSGGGVSGAAGGELGAAAAGVGGKAGRKTKSKIIKK